MYSDFAWHGAPLSGIWCPIVASVGYIMVVLNLKSWMVERKHGVTVLLGFDPKTVQAFHNLVLCGLSLVMVVGTCYELFQRYSVELALPQSRSGWHWFFCEHPDTQPTGPLFFWSYIYYLSKYYELLDTVLQLLIKGRPPPHFFLHVYHHAVVIFMAWNWLEYSQTLQFGGLVFNASVHVVMYYYYYLVVVNRPPWWKRYVTKFQIVQFTWSAACAFYTLKLAWGEGQTCAGMRALYFNFVFNMTLLYQFFGVLGPSKKAKAMASTQEASKEPETILLPKKKQ